MLALVTSPEASLNAGSVGLALARRWSDAAESVLFVDADVSGSRLAARLGQVERAEYSPAVRGLPTLIVAREPLTLKSAAPHCYSLGQGSLWAMFGPFHPEGGELAAAWLSDRVGDLQELDRQRRVVLASSMRPGGTVLAPLLAAAAVLVVVTPVRSGEQAKELWALLRGTDLMGADRALRAIVVEGHCPLDDDEIRVETGGMHVVGRLPVVEDERILRPQGGRRDRAVSRELDEIADQLLAVSKLTEAADPLDPAAARDPAAAHDPAAAPGQGTPEASATLPDLNGHRTEAGLQPRHLLEPGGVSEPDHLLEPGGVSEPDGVSEPGGVSESGGVSEPDEASGALTPGGD